METDERVLGIERKNRRDWERAAEIEQARAEAAEQRVRELERPSGCHPCCDCGEDYGRWGFWVVDDAIWLAVAGPDPTVVLCPICFTKRAEAKLATAVEALRAARRRIRQIHEAGFDSSRRQIALDGICEIDTALSKIDGGA